jgi:hypothetical protein
MTKCGVVGLACLGGVVMLASNASADIRREITERRPYITEVGEPESISMAALRREGDRNSDMREFFSRYGYPDYAEIQEVLPEWPWESYEIRVYYMHWNLEADFGRVLFSDALADLGVLRYQGDIPTEKRHEIEVLMAARTAPRVLTAEQPLGVPAAEPARAEELPPTEEPSGGLTETLVARIEAAAERAARAADAAAEQSEAAARAADRTTSLVERMEDGLSAPGSR